MKKVLITSILLVAGLIQSHAQEVGLSFSYFIPRNGYFSTPISPFSIRGVGFNLNKYLAFETGASLYRMSGLNIIDLPFETRDALLGPNFTLFVPAELVIQFQGKKVEFDIKGGGFFFYGFAQKLNYGNFDRAIRKSENWDVANADLKFENNPGFGYHFGAELTFNVTRQFGISIETNYLMGSSKIPMTGNYTGGSLNGPLQTLPVDYEDSKVDFTGLEFSIGIIFSGR
ncbi:MAG: hypothetical protein JNM78_06820 [Cyclobacteriaceae bacterium]|nr:hypothetical protein [Cyclobacteriaceae bacterium]